VEEENALTGLDVGFEILRLRRIYPKLAVGGR